MLVVTQNKFPGQQKHLGLYKNYHLRHFKLKEEYVMKL